MSPLQRDVCACGIGLALASEVSGAAAPGLGQRVLNCDSPARVLLRPAPEAAAPTPACPPLGWMWAGASLWSPRPLWAASQGCRACHRHRDRGPPAVPVTCALSSLAGSEGQAPGTQPPRPYLGVLHTPCRSG